MPIYPTPDGFEVYNNAGDYLGFANDAQQARRLDSAAEEADEQYDDPNTAWPFIS